MYKSWSDVHPNDVELACLLMADTLLEQKFWLPIQFKDKLLSSIIRVENGELIFDELSLMNAYFFIPKSQRVIVNFILTHLARFRLLFFNIYKTISSIF